MDFDILVLGTGLSQSITTAALSKAGFKVVHVDANQYYGGDDASLNVTELLGWMDERSSVQDSELSLYTIAQRNRFRSISHSSAEIPQARQYAITLTPTIVPSSGPLIDSLIASGVSRYGGFKLLERVAIFSEPGKVNAVPSSKEDVFKDKRISLLDKRRLMRFLMFTGGEFEGKAEIEGNEQTPFPIFLKEKFLLNDETSRAIAYALAFCNSPSDPTLPALHRIRKYLHSTGRYGPSPFLVGHFGGAGEIAQGFCRTSAVGGATYILGRKILSISNSASNSSRKYTVRLEDVDEELSADLIVTEPDYISGTKLTSQADNEENTSYPTARCIAIIDHPISFATSETTQEASEEDTEAHQSGEYENQNTVDTALLVFPPSIIVDGSATSSANVLITGEATVSTPRDRWIIYISMPLLENTSKSAEELLRPYLTATLSLTTPTLAEPLFTLFYIEHPSSPLTPTDSSSILVSKPYAEFLPEIADSAASNGEAMFWKAVGLLKSMGRKPQRNDTEGNVEEGNVEGEVASFWPPLDYVDDGGEW